MLDIKNSLWKTENGSYIFKCVVESCPRHIKAKPYYLAKHSGKCRKCAVRKPPFWHVFNRLKNSAKTRFTISLTYEDFLEYTKIDKCHYCESSIGWMEYAYHNSTYTTAPYYLDRKNNNLGYHKDNCVVCCTKCNKAKGNRYSYREWYGMTEYFRKKKDLKDLDKI